MSTQVQFRRGTTTQNNAFTGAQGELSIDTDLKTIRLHDGTTAGGGSTMLNNISAQTALNKTFSTGSVWQGTAVGLAYGGTGSALTAAAGAVAYSGASGLALNSPGTAGQLLVSGGTGAPTWVSASSISAGSSTTATSASNITGGSAGQLLIQSDTSLTTFITAGAAGTFLQSAGAGYAPTWAAGQVTIGSTAVSLGATVTSFTGLNILTATGTSHWLLPVGTTAQRPGTPGTGMIRYNSTISSFEGYSSGAWSSLGGVKSVDALTYIIAETSAGASNGDLDFYAEDATGLATTQIGQWNRTNLKDYTGTLVGTQTTQNVFNTTATTVNAFGAATALTLGATTGTTTVRNNLVVTGNFTVNGTTQTINATTVQVADKNIELGITGTPTNTTADGGGITLKGTTDKTFNWVNATSAWTSSEHIALAAGKTLVVGGSTSGTTTVQAAAAASGTLTLPAATDTLVGKATTDTLTNKSISFGSNTITMTSAQLATALSDETGSGAAVFGTSPTFTTSFLVAGSSSGTTTVQAAAAASGTLTLPAATDTLVGKATTDTLTNKSISFGSNTITMTSAQLATAVSDETGSGVLVFGTSPTFTTSIDSGATFGAFASSTALTLGYTGTGAGSTTNISTAALTGAFTKTINIGTGGTTGSTTTISIGSTVGSTTTINGTLVASAPAGSLTGSTLASGVTASSLTSTGILTNLQTTSLGVGTAASGTAGEIRATNQITAYYSDDRLKTRGSNIQNALEKVLSLNGFYYEANEIAQALGYKAKPEVGVSAQEVKAVMPEVVVAAPISDEYLTVHYERLVPLLIEAIKEQQKQIEELKAKLGN